MVGNGCGNVLIDMLHAHFRRASHMLLDQLNITVLTEACIFMDGCLMLCAVILSVRGGSRNSF